MNAKMSYVFAEPDSYKDIVELYLISLRRNWADCPYPIFWANQNESLNDPDVHVVNAGGPPLAFCGRLLKAIEAADTKWTLFSNADMVLTKHISTDEFNRVLQNLDDRGGKYCCLRKIPKNRMRADIEFPHFYHMDADRPYSVGLTFGIFETDYLRSLIQSPDWTGWDFEEFCLLLSSRSENTDSYYYDQDIGGTVHLLCKGRLIPSAKKRIIKRGIDISSLQRETLGVKDSFFEAGKRFATTVCPPSMRKSVKRFIRCMGYKSMTKY